MEVLKKGWKIGNDGMIITLQKRHTIIKFDRQFKCTNGQLAGLTIKATSDTTNIAKDATQSMTIKTAHARLAHANEATTNDTSKKLGWKITGNDKNVCLGCALSKAQQKKVQKVTGTKATRPGERLFIDISSLMKPSIGGSKHLGLIVDDYSDYCWDVYLKTKDQLTQQVLPILKKLYVSGKSVKYIRCDNAGENRTLEKNCLEEGLDIKFEYTAPHSPQFNGRVERKFPTIWAKMRALFHEAELTEAMKYKLWSEC